MLDAEDEMTTGNERAQHHADEPLKVPHIVERKRAIGDIERVMRQFKAFQISPQIAHARVGGFLSRPRQHVFGEIDAEHAGRALFNRPSGDPAKAAAEIKQPFPAHIGQQSAQSRPFGPPSNPRTDRSSRL